MRTDETTPVAATGARQAVFGSPAPSHPRRGAPLVPSQPILPMLRPPTCGFLLSRSPPFSFHPFFPVLRPFVYLFIYFPFRFALSASCRIPLGAVEPIMSVWTPHSKTKGSQGQTRKQRSKPSCVEPCIRNPVFGRCPGISWVGGGSCLKLL